MDFKYDLYEPVKAFRMFQEKFWQFLVSIMQLCMCQISKIMSHHRTKFMHELIVRKLRNMVQYMGGWKRIRNKSSARQVIWYRTKITGIFKKRSKEASTILAFLWDQQSLNLIKSVALVFSRKLAMRKIWILASILL